MTYSDDALGPIGEHDREVLVAVARYLNAPTVLEFGSADGHSAQCWLDAGCAHLTCVDYQIREPVKQIAAEHPGRVTLIESRQEDYFPETSDSFNLIFFDASHKLETNIETLQNLMPWLHDEILLVVHDTGLWAESAMSEQHRNFTGTMTPCGYMHQPGERQFVNYLADEGWQCISLSSRTALRHGLTLARKTIL